MGVARREWAWHGGSGRSSAGVDVAGGSGRGTVGVGVARREWVRHGGSGRGRARVGVNKRRGGGS